MAIIQNVSPQSTVEKPKLKYVTKTSNKTGKQYTCLELSYKGVSKPIFLNGDAERILWGDICDKF